MKTNIGVRTALAVLVLAALPVITEAQPRISFRLEFGAPPVSRDYGSLGEYYRVPNDDIYLMHESGVADEDIPLILYIYTHSQYSLRQIYSLRLRGATWEQLSNWCGVPLNYDRGGPPYGNAYGYYSHGPGNRWNGYGRSRDEGEGYHGKGWNGEREEHRFQGEHRERGDDD